MQTNSTQVTKHADDDLEQFSARILFTGDHTNELYIYNREVFNGLFNIAPSAVNNCQFVEIGDTLTLDSKRFKVKNINIMLYDKVQDMVWARQYGVNAKSPSEPTNFNLQIGIFVERA